MPAIFSRTELCVCSGAEEQHVQTWSLRLSVYLSPGLAKLMHVPDFAGFVYK